MAVLTPFTLPKHGIPLHTPLSPLIPLPSISSHSCFHSFSLSLSLSLFACLRYPLISLVHYLYFFHFLLSFSVCCFHHHHHHHHHHYFYYYYHHHHQHQQFLLWFVLSCLVVSVGSRFLFHCIVCVVLSCRVFFLSCRIVFVLVWFS